MLVRQQENRRNRTEQQDRTSLTILINIQLLDEDVNNLYKDGAKER